MIYRIRIDESIEPSHLLEAANIMKHSAEPAEFRIHVGLNGNFGTQPGNAIRMINFQLDLRI